jgi:hypothetical protein
MGGWSKLPYQPFTERLAAALRRTGDARVAVISENSWLSFAKGQPYRGKVRALGSSLDCASLAAR